jgi:hypothetical protein
MHADMVMVAAEKMTAGLLGSSHHQETITR